MEPLNAKSVKTPVQSQLNPEPGAKVTNDSITSANARSHSRRNPPSSNHHVAFNDQSGSLKQGTASDDDTEVVNMSFAQKSFTRTQPGIVTAANLNNDLTQSIALREFVNVHAAVEDTNEANQELLRVGSLSLHQKEQITKELVQGEQVQNTLTVYHTPTVIQNWYTPFRVQPISDFNWGLRFNNYRHLVVAFNGNHVDFDIPVLIVRAAVLVIWWYMWYHLLLFDAGEPGGVVFDTVVTVIVSAVIGGTITAMIGIPALLGTLIWGLVWSSLDLTTGIPKVMFKHSKSVGATVILVKAGLSLNIVTLKEVIGTSLILASVPVVAEAAIHYGMSIAILDLDGIPAWLLGFALTGTSPALVVAGGVILQAQGRGLKAGILAMLYSASAMNIALCLLVFNVLEEIEYGEPDNISLTIGLIPVQIIGGIILGIICAYICAIFCRVSVAVRNTDGSSQFPTDKYLTALVVAIAISMYYGGSYYKFAGGGVIAVFTFAVAVNHLMTRDSSNHDLIEVKKKTSIQIGALWDLLVQPWLFSLVGASKKFSDIFSSDTPKALALFGVGAVGRMLVIILVLAPTRLTWKEIIYIGLAWMGKATPQAALGGIVIDKHPTVPEGKTIQTISIMCIFFVGPLSAVLTKVFAGLVRTDEEYAADITPVEMNEPTQVVLSEDKTAAVPVIEAVPVLEANKSLAPSHGNS